MFTLLLREMFMLIFLTFRCLNGDWSKHRSEGSTILPRSKAAREEGQR